MRVLRQLTALLALPAATLAVTLSDFIPRVSDLPTSCDAVYTATISGCQPSDFENECSKTCVLALNTLTSYVQTACGGEGITGSNIIVQFLDGNGPQSLCSNAASFLSSSTSATQAATQMTSTTSSASSSTASTVKATSSTTSTTADTSSATATRTVVPESSSATPSSSSILADTSSQTATETSTATSSTQRSSQTDQIHSGGGSPFDDEGNTASGASTISSIPMLTALVSMLSTLVLIAS